MISNSIYIDAFNNYSKMGLDPLPIPYEDGHPTKGPKIKDWPSKAANHDFTESDFENASGVGVQTGGPKNLTDIDCDSPEAVRIGAEILDEYEKRTRTKHFKFGRSSKPRAHSIFATDKSRPSEKITDPTDDQCIVEYRCVKENGDRGLQTVFPESLNYDPKTGRIEQLRFEHDSAAEPSFIEAGKLRSMFKVIAATALLAKHFPTEGRRHNTILALAGVFASNGVPEKKAVEIVSLAYRHSAAYNGDQNKAENDVRSVYKTHRKDSATHLYGYPTLTDILPKEVVDKVLDLLGVEPSKTRYHLTDAGNGLRLIDKYANEIRYCVDLRCWMVWDGIRWVHDQANRIRELAKGIAADIRREADEVKPPQLTGNRDADDEALAEVEARRREFHKWANRTENADGVSKAIISAASDPRITCFRSDFDKQVNLLNCPNCVVDLYTGKTMPHDRKPDVELSVSDRVRRRR